MTSKELKRLSRKELLELLIDQRDALAQMQAELEDAKAQLGVSFWSRPVPWQRRH